MLGRFDKARRVTRSKASRQLHDTHPHPGSSCVNAALFALSGPKLIFKDDAEAASAVLAALFLLSIVESR